jgi:hypothetical protein
VALRKMTCLYLFASNAGTGEEFVFRYTRARDYAVELIKVTMTRIRHA